MIKCTICENHVRDGAKHTCRKCDTKTIYGEIQEQFIECCSYFKMIEAEKKRQAYIKKIDRLPIDDRGQDGHYPPGNGHDAGGGADTRET